MAIVRCKNHILIGKTRTYAGNVEPVGYPETAMVCGRKNCSDPGLIWLEEYEKDLYDKGERIFKSFTDTMKMRAK